MAAEKSKTSAASSRLVGAVYYLHNTFHNEGLKGLMKKPRRPGGSTIPDPLAREIRRVREANPRIGSRRIKWLLQIASHTPRYTGSSEAWAW